MTVFQNNLGVEDIRNATEDVSSIAEQFHKLYYDSLDSKRHLMTRLYMETAVLVWNGNPYQNIAEIQKFYEQLPTTNHNVLCVDAQLLSSHAVGSQKTLLIQIAGKARLLEGSDKSFKPFQQAFIVTAQGDKWKIVSDIYRQQLPYDALGLSVQEQQMQQLQFQQMQQLQLQQQQQAPPPTYYSSPDQSQLQLQQQSIQQQQHMQMQMQQLQLQQQQAQFAGAPQQQQQQQAFNFAS